MEVIMDYMEACRIRLREIQLRRYKKKPSKFVYKRIVVKGRKIVMRRRSKALEAELRAA